MKILFLASAKSIHTIRWVNALAERNHKVFLAFNKNDYDINTKINTKIKLIELRFEGMKGYYLNAHQLYSIYSHIKPDIVNAHYASGYGTLARKAKLKPLLISVWGSDVYDFPFRNKLFNYIIKQNLLYADMIASTSNCMLKQVEGILGKKVKGAVTPFGVDILKFYEKDYKKESEEIIIGCIKTLDEKYGIKYLIKAVYLLINNLNKNGHKDLGKKIKCCIYGDGKQKEELEQLIRKLKLSNVVKLLGKIPHEEVPKALECMDIFCVTSIYESFGVAVVEAEAMGIPVIVSDVDGFCEVVDHGKTGIIVKRKSAKETAKALETLILNKQLRDRMGKNGRKKVVELYDWNENVKVMESVYSKLIVQGNGF